eukprot:TRINITY_DN11832_c0_g1_i1.p1 TRINITY_DN11832_c0_g1~~TRINITY_DN11832_c0_g1_i1.p1  ORF type:complete len:362 (-),score=58.86 TRINITY_DN11832_c0_g1_i1:16-1002(-)
MEAMMKVAQSSSGQSSGHSLRVSRLAWDDPTVDWSDVNLAIPIEVWSYYEKIPQFIAWLDAMAAQKDRCRLANGVNVVRWNVCKIYLDAMEKRGVAIVPTKFVANPAGAAAGSVRPPYTVSKSLIPCSADDQTLKSFISSIKNGIIVKTTISAGAHQTVRVSSQDSTSAKAVELSKEVLQGAPHYVDVMVQPFLPEIEQDGERSMVFIQGKLMHAIRKVPRDGDFRVQKKYGGQYQTFTPSEEELTFGETTLKVANDLINETFPDGGDANLIVYARCDYVIADDGTGVKKPLLMELEMIEPELFIPYSTMGEAGFESVAKVFLSLVQK